MKTIAISLNRRGVEDINNHSGIYSITVNAVTGFKPPFTRATSTKATFRATDYSNQTLIKTFAGFSKETDNDYIGTRKSVEATSKKSVLTEFTSKERSNCQETFLVCQSHHRLSSETTLAKMQNEFLSNWISIDVKCPIHVFTTVSKI